MVETVTPPDDKALIKNCCAGLYQSEWAYWLLGDSFHPGGLALTRRLGELLELGPSKRLLDVASGRGTSALYLAKTFGCEVVGIDYGQQSVHIANELAHKGGLADLVRFQEGDAEELPFATGSFDSVYCECSFCTFPAKPQAAREMARVLRENGSMGLSDLTRSGPVPAELQSLIGWISCIAGAQSIQETISYFEAAGMEYEMHEDHDKALAQFVHETRGRLISADLIIRLNGTSTSLANTDLQKAKALARHAEAAIKAGQFGYALALFTKPLS